MELKLNCWTFDDERFHINLSPPITINSICTKISDTLNWDLDAVCVVWEEAIHKYSHFEYEQALNVTGWETYPPTFIVAWRKKELPPVSPKPDSDEDFDSDTGTPVHPPEPPTTEEEGEHSGVENSA